MLVHIGGHIFLRPTHPPHDLLYSMQNNCKKHPRNRNKKLCPSCAFSPLFLSCTSPAAVGCQCSFHAALGSRRPAALLQTLSSSSSYQNISETPLFGSQLWAHGPLFQRKPKKGEIVHILQVAHGQMRSTAYFGKKPSSYKTKGNCQRGTIGSLIRSRVTHACTHIHTPFAKQHIFFLFFSSLVSKIVRLPVWNERILCAEQVFDLQD